MNPAERAAALTCKQRTRTINRLAAYAGFFALLTQTAFAGAVYRPGQEQRTVTASTYQVSVQKNGRIDISLLNGDAVFLNAFPAILFEGEEEWTELDIASRYTFRERVQDSLGQGQALIMAKGNCEWAIRTYSTQPFFTVQAVFINTTKKPVHVSAASPWSTGDTRKSGGLWLGEDTAGVRTLILDEQPAGFVNTRIARDVPLQSQWQTAVFNPRTGRSLIAGFLSLNENKQSYTLDRLPDSSENAPIELFRAMTAYDAPVEVAPGDRLEMPILYFSVSESNPLIGLRRFGQALGRFNDFDSGSSGSPPGAGGLGSAQILRGERSEIARLHASDPTSWEEAADALCSSVRLFHLSPYFWRPDVGSPRLDIPSLSDAQQLAWISGLALSGGDVRAEDDHDAIASHLLARFAPALERSAQPVDLFRDDRPRIWALPMDDAGEHIVLGLFNWDTDAPTREEILFNEIGLANNAYYTVFDSMERQYLGTAVERLGVEVPSGSVRILSLRRNVDWPAVLSVGDHFTTASSAEDATKWDAATNTLSGTVHAQTDEPVRIDVLVPERFGTITASSDNVHVEWQENERVLRVFVSGAVGVPAKWSVAFR